MYVLKGSPFLRGRIRNAFQDIHGCQQIASQQAAPRNLVKHSESADLHSKSLLPHVRAGFIVQPFLVQAQKGWTLKPLTSSVPQFYFFEKYHIVRKESTR